MMGKGEPIFSGVKLGGGVANIVDKGAVTRREHIWRGMKGELAFCGGELIRLCEGEREQGEKNQVHVIGFDSSEGGEGGGKILMFDQERREGPNISCLLTCFREKSRWSLQLGNRT